MLYLLNFFEGEGEAANNPNAWITYVILGVLLVGVVLMMILPQRKQKKKNEEMMAKLAVGSFVTTIGGIIGEVVDLDDKYIWLSTGIEDNKTTMKFLRQAIHAIEPAPGSPEAKAEEKAAQKEENEIDEIK